MKRFQLYILTLLCILTSVACGDDDDYRFDSGGRTQGDDASVTVLQKHTKGNGIMFVLMCDGFTQRDIDNGTYRRVTLDAMEGLFSDQPMASLREYVDVYEVSVPSATRGITSKEGDTAFRCYIPSTKSSTIMGSDSLVIAHASKVVPTSKWNEAVVVVLLNNSQHAGITYMHINAASTKEKIPGGFAYCFIPVYATRTTKSGVVNELPMLVQHEAVGHAFAKLADEYSESGNGSIPVSEKLELERYQGYGAFCNVSLTSDVKKSPWAQFAADDRFLSEGLRCIEGCYTYGKGVYRATYESVMNASLKGFNAPSRCAIYKRAMWLANGTNWSFDYDAFVEFDAAYRDGSSKAKGVDAAASEQLPPLAAPIILK